MTIFGRILQAVLIGLLLFGLFVLGGMVFLITMAVIAALAGVSWLRTKGVIPDTRGKFQQYSSADDVQTPEKTVIEADFYEVDEPEDNPASVEQNK